MGPSGNAPASAMLSYWWSAHDPADGNTLLHGNTRSWTVVHTRVLHLVKHTVGVLRKNEAILACICWADDFLTRPAESEVLLPCL